MALLHRRPDTVADPGVLASTYTPESSQTREENDNTDSINRTRRLVVLGAGGGLALAATGGIAWWRSLADGHTERAPDAAQTPNRILPRGDFDSVPRVFDSELALDQITMPATLNPPSFEEAFTAMGDAVQYYVNHDPNGITQVVPGTAYPGAMQPEQFEFRGDWIAGYRPSARGTVNDDPNSADNPLYYAWGFKVKLLQQTSHVGEDINKADQVAGKVQIEVGDYRPTLDGKGTRSIHIEKPQAYECDMVLTRWKDYARGELMPGNTWTIFQMNFPEVPGKMQKYPPSQFPSVPPLYLPHF